MSEDRRRRPSRAYREGADLRLLRRSARAVLGNDADFDRLLPEDLQRLSRAYFTPVEVAKRAASLLVSRPGDCVLDVGSGVGKFCLVAAAYSAGGVFVGVEERPRLASIANALAEQLAIPNVAFTQANLIEIDWSPYDAFYFYNPFVEHAAPWMIPLDRETARGPAHLFFYVRFVRQRLLEAKLGTRVVTYHGFGGAPPGGYVRMVDERIGSGRLALWVKTEEPSVRRPDDDDTADKTAID